MKKTYETDHPIIKEIRIGDKFVLNNGDIVSFVEYDKNEESYPFLMNDRTSYTKDLKFSDLEKHHGWNIKQRYLSLKDKINLL